MKPEKIQNSYPQSPQDFHNAILFSLVKLDDKAPVRYKRNRVLKTAVVFAIILALCTSSVFAAEKIWSLFSEPVDNYGLNVKASAPTEDDAPEYVKLVLSYLPEGVIESPNTNGRKYSLNGEAKEMWFTFDISKIDSDFEHTINYITDSYETTVNGNRVIIFDRTFADNDDDNQKGFYEYFENWGMLVSCLCDGNISDDELNKVIEGVSLAEGTNDNHFYVASDEETIPTVPYEFEYRNSYTLGELNKDFNCKNISTGELGFNVKVKSIEVHDNTSYLDSDSFYFNEYLPDDGNGTYSTYFDSEGNIITPYTRENITYGDGINTIDKVEKETVDRHFVLATLEVTGLEEPAGEDLDVFYTWSLWLCNMTNDGDGKLSPIDDDYIAGTMVYAESPDQYDLYVINKDETRTITVGFFVDEDKMDDLYFTVKTDDGDKKTLFDGEKYYSEANSVCFKVER